MKTKVDWEKPIRFVKVQDDNHADYVPRYVGSFMNDTNKRRHVVCTRHWDHAVSFAVYNDDGELLNIPNNKDVTNASGIFNATIVNGDPITTERVDVRGAWIDVTFDGDKAVKSKIIR